MGSSRRAWRAGVRPREGATSRRGPCPPGRRPEVRCGNQGRSREQRGELGSSLRRGGRRPVGVVGTPPPPRSVQPPSQKPCTRAGGAGSGSRVDKAPASPLGGQGHTWEVGRPDGHGQGLYFLFHGMRGSPRGDGVGREASIAGCAVSPGEHSEVDSPAPPLPAPPPPGRPRCGLRRRRALSLRVLPGWFCTHRRHHEVLGSVRARCCCITGSPPGSSGLAVTLPCRGREPESAPSRWARRAGHMLLRALLGLRARPCFVSPYLSLCLFFFFFLS